MNRGYEHSRVGKHSDKGKPLVLMKWLSCALSHLADVREDHSTPDSKKVSPPWAKANEVLS